MKIITGTITEIQVSIRCIVFDQDHRRVQVLEDGYAHRMLKVNFIPSSAWCSRCRVRTVRI